MRNAEVTPCVSQSSFAWGEKETSQLRVSSGNYPLGRLLLMWLLDHVGFVSGSNLQILEEGLPGLEWPGQSLLMSLYEVPACFLICRDLNNSASSRDC